MSKAAAKPQPSGATGTTGKIRRAHLAMQRCADAVLSPRRITMDQCSLLWVVWRREGIRQNELAFELYTDPNTVTAMVVRLEKQGLIRREVCAEDGRARCVSLTPAGRRMVARLSDDWAPMRQKLHELFAGDGGQEALRILDQVRAVMTEAREEVLAKRAKPPTGRTASSRRVVAMPAPDTLH
jgi:MarR family transcriptional regulator for hemolysin